MAREPNEYHLVTFDPGGTTGWTHFVLSLKAFSRPEHKVLKYVKAWNCGEYSGTEHEQLEQACRLIHLARFGVMPYVSDTAVVSTGHALTEIVSEDFELMQTIGGNNLLSVVRINAVLGWECRRQGLRLQLQKRSMRTSVTPERLLMMGYRSPVNRSGRWTTTSRGKDAFAAMQHAIVWLKRLKAESLSKPWKLSDGQTANAYYDCACRRGRRCDLVHLR